jgi:hypothetical protein
MQLLTVKRPNRETITPYSLKDERTRGWLRSA